MEKFYKFISSNFENTLNEDFQGGTLLISFIVETDGTLSNIKNLKDVDFATEKEAIRVLKNCPRWIPAEQDGEKIRVEFTFPINVGHYEESKISYQLTSRKAISLPKPTNNCNENGIVVVEISVDDTGKVIKATAGIKGTTNTSECLLEQAEKSALNSIFDKYKTQNDNVNSSVGQLVKLINTKQKGKIIYNF